MLLPEDYIVWDKELSLDDKSLVGIEIASLGELSTRGISVLPQLIVTSHAYSLFLQDNNCTTQIKHLLGTINHNNHQSLSQISEYIQNIILRSTIHENISTPLFKKLERLESYKLNITAYYFQGNKIISIKNLTDLKGESVIIAKLRELWAQLFAKNNLSAYSIHHENHHTFKVVTVISPVFDFELTGHLKTGSNKNQEIEIEAHSMTRFSYSKKTRKFEHAKVLSNGKKDALNIRELKELIETANMSEKAFYHPQIIYWGKWKDKIFVTKVVPITEEIRYSDTFNSMMNYFTIHPGVTVGKLRVVNEKGHEGLIFKDEIIVLKTLDKKIIDSVKKAKGIILEETPNQEITEILRSFGIPTLVKKNKLLYSTGDIVSLNATTGEVKRGSILIS